MLNRLKEITEEIIGEETLIKLIKNNQSINHYIGFEISGKPHIGSAVMSMAVIKELQSLGVNCKVFLADWHSWINNKLGGDLEFIREVGIPFFKANMIAGAKVVGADVDKIEFVTGSEIAQDMMYWATVVDVSKNTTLSRIQRSISIMGRKEGESVDFAKLIYPPMQVADIFFMNINIAHAGMDQRKAHVIAIDVADKIKFNNLKLDDKKIKPIAIHHHLLMGLTPPNPELLKKIEQNEIEIANVGTDLKMSKSKPDSAIFMTDTEDEVNRKINKAYCPEGVVQLNPILDWVEHLIFNVMNFTLKVERPEKWGGDVEYFDYQTLQNDFIEKKLHPADLKKAVAKTLNQILDPAREYLNQDEIKQWRKQIEEKVSR
ncbi:MAG: tyrosine--tRNA ligase [Candidatus Dojkabacteria bacterium]|nr:MAG: tyrosine--tRNA ligase [Candidatus Dojkabacteria bacterium]